MTVKIAPDPMEVAAFTCSRSPLPKHLASRIITASAPGIVVVVVVAIAVVARIFFFLIVDTVDEVEVEVIVSVEELSVPLLSGNGVVVLVVSAADSARPFCLIVAGVVMEGADLSGVESVVSFSGSAKAAG